MTDGEEGGIEEAQLDAIITKLRQDKTRATNIAVDALPPEVREPVYSNAFYVRCLERFKLADWSCNGTLSPDEIIDIFRDMVPERLRQAVQLTHAEQLVEIFDDDKDGQLTREEFYRFCQLTVLAAHIAEQEKKMCTVDPASETAKKVSEVAAHVRSVDVRLGSLAKIEAKVDRLLEAQLALCARVGGLEERQAVTEEALPARHRLRLDSIGSEQSNDTTRDLPSTSENPNERG